MSTRTYSDQQAIATVATAGGQFVANPYFEALGSANWYCSTHSIYTQPYSWQSAGGLNCPEGQGFGWCHWPNSGSGKRSGIMTDTTGLTANAWYLWSGWIYLADQCPAIIMGVLSASAGLIEKGRIETSERNKWVYFAVPWESGQTGVTWGFETDGQCYQNADSWIGIDAVTLRGWYSVYMDGAETACTAAVMENSSYFVGQRVRTTVHHPNMPVITGAYGGA